MNSRPFDDNLIAHRPWLHSVIRSRVRESDVVDDLVNDVMTEAVTIREKGQHESIVELGPWLYRVAIRKVLQFRRSSARRRKHQQAYSEERVARGETLWLQQPIESMLGDEREMTVRVAVEKLKGQDAEILLLKYVHQWSYAQIAKHLGLTHSKVTHRLRRARGRLKTELTQMGWEENHEN